MATTLLAFAVFAVAVAAMAVGVVLGGRSLSRSCGGVADAVESDLLGDCVCVRKAANLCVSDEGNELVRLAELGNPMRKDYFRTVPEGGPSVEV